MSIILILFYLLLFIGSIFSIRIMAIAIPIFTFVYPKQLSALALGDANLSMVFLLFCGVRLLFYGTHRILDYRQKQWRNYILLYFFVVYIGTQILSLLFIPVNEYINCFKSIIEGFLCLSAVLTMYFLMINDKYRYPLIVGLTVAILLESVVAIGLMDNFTMFSMFYSGKELEDQSWYYRATGTFNGPWALGGFLAIAIIFIFYIFSTQNFNLIFKILLISTAVIALYALVLTASRAGWVLLVVAIAYLSIRGNTAFIKSLLAVVVIGLIAVNYWIDWEEVSFLVTHRIEYTYNNSVTGSIDASTLERVHIWERVLDNYNPAYLLTGYGIRNAYNAFGSTPHNTFLSLFIYSGLIGYYIVLKFLHEGYLLGKSNSSNAQRFFTATLIGLGAYCFSADLLYDIRAFSLGLAVLTLYIMAPTSAKS